MEPDILISRRDAKDEKRFIDKFNAFNEYALTQTQGQLLKVCSYLPFPSNVLEKGGGLGKTKILEYFYKYSEVSIPSVPYQLIDLFEDTTNFRLINKIFFNLWHQLDEVKTVFETYYAFLNGLDAEERDNVADHLSAQAFQKIKEDLKMDALKQAIQNKKEQKKPILLFFDAFEYMEQPKNVNAHTNYNHELYKDFVKPESENEISIFQALMNSGVSLVLSGREVKAFEVEAWETCHVGALFPSELEDFIQSVKAKTVTRADIVLIKKMTESRPIIVDILFEVLDKQLKVKEQTDPFALQTALSKLIQNYSEKGFEKEVFQDLHQKTANRNASMALYYMSVAHYGVTSEMIAYLLGRDTKNVQPIMNELRNWSYTKKTAYNATKLSPAICSLLKKVGMEASNNDEYRLHDEMVLLINEHYWKGQKHHFLQKEFFQEILYFYEDTYLKKTDSTIPSVQSGGYRRRLREYYEYRLEKIAAFVDKEDMTNPQIANEITQELEMVIDEIAYNVVSVIDQYPEHAKRLIGKTDNFFEKCLQDAWQDAADKMALLKVDLGIEKPKLPFINPEDIAIKSPKRVKALAHYSKAFAQQAEAAIHEYDFETANIALYQSSRFAYESSDSISIAWATHLRGFYYQEKGNFAEAMQWQLAAIDSAYDAILFLTSKQEPQKADKQADSTSKSNESSAVVKLELKIAAKTIISAIEHIAYIRYIQGDLSGSANYGKLLCYTHSATKIGSKSLVYALIGLYRSYTLMEHTIEQKTILQQLKNIDFKYDKALKQFFALSEVVEQLKSIEDLDTPLPFIAGADSNPFKKALEACIEKLIQNVFEPEFHHTDIDTVSKETVETVANHDILEMFHIYGKIRLQLKDFERAESAFEMARCVALKMQFKYSEVAAEEALFRVSYARHQHCPSATSGASLQQRQTNLATWITSLLTHKPKILYHDLFAKFYATSGHMAFDRAANQGQAQIENWRSAFKLYAQMLVHAYQHNENRYDMALGILWDRLQKIIQSHPHHLDGLCDLCVQTLREAFDNQQIPFDEQLSKFIMYCKTILSVTYQLEPTTEALENPFNVIQVIYELNYKGRHFQATLLAKWMLDHHKTQFAQMTYDASPAAYEQQQEDLTMAYFHYSIALQHHRKSEQVMNQPLEAAITQLKESHHFPKSKQKVLETALKIQQCVCKYRTQEFWNLERFIRGELKHFVVRYNNHDHGLNRKPVEALIAEVGAHLLVLVDFCQMQWNIGQLHHASYRYLRLLCEGCFRLGELCLLTEQNYDHPNQPCANQLLNDKLEALYKKTIEQPSVWAVENDIWHDDPAFAQFAKHQTELGAYSGAVYLSYTYQFSKWMGDGHSAVQSLETIANLYYFKDQFDKKINIPTTVKYYALTAEQQKKFEKKEQAHVRPKFNDAFKKAFFTEKDFQYPFVLAQMKIVQGDAVFSKIFEIDESSYNKIDSLLKQNGSLKADNRLLLESYKVRADMNERPEECRKYIHIMFLNYLKALNLLAVVPYDSFVYHNMVSEIIRRLLLIQEQTFLTIIERDLKAIWLSFDNLRARPETLNQLLLTAKVHRVGLLMSN